MASLLNKAQTRSFILAMVKKKRPGWKCTRVASETFEDLEAFLPSVLREVAREQPEAGADKYAGHATSLLTRSEVKKRLLDLFGQRHPWFRCDRVHDVAVDYVQHRLEKRILGMVSRHPSGCGQTFKTT